MLKSLKVLCSGTGYFSQYHYDAWSRIENAKIVGVCNRTIGNAKLFADKYDIPYCGDNLSRMIDQSKPNIIDIITPPQTHLEAVSTAAKFGIDIICQKPFGENLDQAEDMVNIAKDAGIKLIIHENFRFMPWYRQTKAIVDSGTLGTILNVTFTLRPGDGQGAAAYLARQPYFQTMPRFLVHETAIHLVDTFRFLFGEPESIYAQLRRCNPVIKGEDSGIILLNYADNLQVVFDGNRLLDHNSTNTRRTMGELEISGTMGTLRLDGEARLWLRKFGECENKEVHYQWNDQNFGGDCVFETIQHIVAHFAEDQELENQGFEYLRNLRIEKAIYQSAKSGRKIDLSA